MIERRTTVTRESDALGVAILVIAIAAIIALLVWQPWAASTSGPSIQTTTQHTTQNTH